MAELKPKRYTVNLRKSSEDRWDELLSDPWATNKALRLAEEIKRQAGFLRTTVGKALSRIAFALSDSETNYSDDIDVWTEYCFEDKGLTAMANLSYELNSLCTSVAFWRPGLGMVHARNLDWNLPGMKKATILIDYMKASAGDFTAVSVPGLIGVLSGVAKGRFSATINQAPPLSGKNLLGCSAPLLLRFVFEQCKTFNEAVHTLRENECFAPVFFQVTGCKKGESAVVAHHPKEGTKVYEYDDFPLAVTNHDDDFSSPELISSDDDIKDDDSCERLGLILKYADKCRAKTLGQVAKVLDDYPIMSDITQQSMVFQPKTGKVYLQKL
jgi:hypothetical protein